MANEKSYIVTLYTQADPKEPDEGTAEACTAFFRIACTIVLIVPMGTMHNAASVLHRHCHGTIEDPEEENVVSESQFSGQAIDEHAEPQHISHVLLIDLS